MAPQYTPCGPSRPVASGLRRHYKPSVCATHAAHPAKDLTMPYDMRTRFFSEIHLYTAYKAPPQQNAAMDQNSHRSL